MPFLGAARIVIDQATRPPGVAGVSRDDGVTGQVVTLRNADNTNISANTGGWLWVLFKPRASAAVLSSPTSPSCTFTPDVDGTYRVELYVNEKQKPSQKARAAFAVKSIGGFRYPAQGESIEANWTSSYTLAPNETGWWESIDEILRSGQAAIDGSTITVVTEAGLPQSRRLQVGAGLSLVDGGPGGDITLDAPTAGPAGTRRYADVALSPENILSTRTVEASTRDNAKKGQVNLGAEAVGAKGTKADYASISGGLDNLASGTGSHVSGGSTNTASAAQAGVVAGLSNVASGVQSFVGGGTLNTSAGLCGGLVAGTGNEIAGDYAFVGAGNANRVYDDKSGIVAGNNNEINKTTAFIGAGSDNTIGAAGTDAGIAAGSANTANASCAFIGGGSGNTASGAYSAIPGGRDSAATASDAHAWGRGAQATNAGSIVIKDGANTTQSSSADNEITLRADGGLRQICSGAKITTRLGSSTSNYAERSMGQQTTTDASAQTVNIASIPSGQDCTVTVSLKGKQNGSANCKSFYYVATYTNNGGAVALTGAAHVNSTQATGLAAATVAVGISGTSLQLQFAGIAATTIRWTYDVTIHYGGAT